jgi:hypothetical protein
MYRRDEELPGQCKLFLHRFGKWKRALSSIFSQAGGTGRFTPGLLRTVDGFTHEYGVTRLVWYEQHGTAEEAITREKQIKNWKRAWKLELIEKANPYWNDLYDEIIR